MNGAFPEKARLVGLAPAYMPEPALARIVEELKKSGLFMAIVVVDDGSGPEYEKSFEALEAAGCHVLRHGRNRGKGAALKTGIEHIINKWPHCLGIATFDADGQHTPGDIIGTAAMFLRQPGSLTLGSREFGGNVPLRSALGNKLTRIAMSLFCGINIGDTQTGMRILPIKLAAECLKIRRDGYDFECDMLLKAKALGIPIQENRIAAIYIEQNRSSHFNPLLDSIRIYSTFLKFGFVAICSALLDYVIFTIAIFLGQSILTSLIICRTISATFNFLLGKSFVFASKGGFFHSLMLYAALVACSGIVSYLGIYFLSLLFGGGKLAILAAKFITESIMFVANFIIEREVIFKNGAKI